MCQNGHIPFLIRLSIKQERVKSFFVIISGLGAFFLASCTPRVVGVQEALLIPKTLGSASIATSSLNAKVCLEGAANAVTLPTDQTALDRILTARSKLPSVQPFDVAPFNYRGSEVLSESAKRLRDSGGILDWILIRVRSRSAPFDGISARAGLLLPDGRVVDVDGSSPLAFSQLSDGTYRVSVHSRTHLAGLSDKTFAMNAKAPVAIDLTQDQSYTALEGSLSSVEVNGASCLPAGDLNGDGTVDTFDLAAMQNRMVLQGGAGGTPEDLNYDGVVDPHDLDLMEANSMHFVFSPIRN
jgi:hypothetical protein